MIPRREHLRAPEDSSFPAHRAQRHGFPFAWHWHPECELTLILKGHGERYVGDHIEPFEAGDLVLLGGNLPHSWSTPVRDDLWCEAVVVQFDPLRLGSAFWSLPETQDMTQMLQRAARGICFQCEGVADRLAELPSLKPALRLARLLAVLAELSEAPARTLCSEHYSADPSRRDHERLERVLTSLHERYREEVTVQSVASLLSLTPEAACRFFKRNTGRTIVQYLHNLRVAEACRLLTETDEAISAIAFAVGFGNLPHFNRVFRRERGMTPRAFRKSARLRG